MENKTCACGNEMKMMCEPSHDGEHQQTCKWKCDACGAEMPATPEETAAKEESAEEGSAM